jgi:hypothetical protein
MIAIGNLVIMREAPPIPKGPAYINTTTLIISLVWERFQNSMTWRRFIAPT